MPSNALRTAQRQALAEAIPLFIPALPFGFVVGLAIAESPVPDGIGFLSSPLIFAGAAQLALVSLAGTASLWAAVAAAIVINARHLMYSAALSPVFKDQPRWFRWIGPYFLIDQVFALTVPRTDEPPEVFRRYYLTAASVFFIGWQVVTVVGMFFGSFIPESWQLGYAPAVMFIGIVVMGIDRRPAVIASVVGAVVCFVALGLPNRSGLLVGALSGVVAGFLAERWMPPVEIRAESRS